MKKTQIIFILLLSIIFVRCSEDKVQELTKTDSIHEGKIQTKADQPEIAYPNAKKELFNTNPKQADNITLEKYNNQYIFQGDILLTDAQVEKLSSTKTRGAALSSLAKRWTNSTVHYRINDNLPNSTKQKIKAAIDHYLQLLPELHFAYHPNWYIRQKNYVEFVPANFCASYLGMKGGKQEIFLSQSCSTGNVIHEIGHALGLFHEQSRPSRDNYITINYNNIKPSAKHNFQTYQERNLSGYERGPFDFGSIMLYGSYAFSINGKPTIVKKNGSTYAAQRTALSHGDLDMLRHMYQNISRPLPCVKNFIIKSNPNILQTSNTRCYYNFDIKGNYGFEEIKLSVYEGKQTKNNTDKSKCCGYSRWNREADYEVNYPNYTTKKWWCYWNWDYGQSYNIKGKEFTLVVEFQGRKQFLYYTVPNW